MLTIYGHPISSYTWKVLAALYENDTPFEFVTLDQNTYPDFLAKWPLGQFPVLVDSNRNRIARSARTHREHDGRLREPTGASDKSGNER